MISHLQSDHLRLPTPVRPHPMPHCNIGVMQTHDTGIAVCQHNLRLETKSSAAVLDMHSSMMCTSSVYTLHNPTIQAAIAEPHTLKALDAYE